MTGRDLLGDEFLTAPHYKLEETARTFSETARRPARVYDTGPYTAAGYSGLSVLPTSPGKFESDLRRALGSRDFLGPRALSDRQALRSLVENAQGRTSGSAAMEAWQKRSLEISGEMISSSATLTDLVERLHQAEVQLRQRDQKILELGASLRQSQEMNKEMLSARKTAKDAVDDMARQNAKLIQSYLEKKSQVKELQRAAARDSTGAAKDLDRERSQINKLRQANDSLQEELKTARAELKALKKKKLTVRVPTSAASETKQPSPTARKLKRNLTPRTVHIASLEDHNSRLAEENAQLRDEADAILQRTVRRDKADHYKRMASVAFQHQQYQESAEHYGSAIELAEEGDNYDSAVLYSNRAACHLSMGSLVECIADCTVAIDLDSTYLRTYQRRADAYMALGHSLGAANDLIRMMEISGGREDLQPVVNSMLNQCKGPQVVNHYKVLGVTQSASEADIRSAYKQLALRYHPDKAVSPGQKQTAEIIIKFVNDAQRILSNSALRDDFDKQLSQQRR